MGDEDHGLGPPEATSQPHSAADAGVVLEIESDDCPMALGGWRPGWNCGTHLADRNSWSPQCLVLVVNIFHAVKRLAWDLKSVQIL